MKVAAAIHKTMMLAAAIEKTMIMVAKSRMYQKVGATSDGATMEMSGVRVISDSDSTVEVVAECKAPPTPSSAGGRKLSQGSPTVPSSFLANKRQKTTKVDTFKPKRDRRMEKLMGKIESDGDVWVERLNVNPKGERMYYYRSYLNPKRCVMFEPPTGSGKIIFLDELDNYPPEVRAFATETIGIPKSAIERPDYRGKTYRERQKELAKKKKWAIFS